MIEKIRGNIEELGFRDAIFYFLYRLFLLIGFRLSRYAQTLGGTGHEFLNSWRDTHKHLAVAVSVAPVCVHSVAALTNGTAVCSRPAVRGPGALAKLATCSFTREPIDCGP